MSHAQRSTTEEAPLQMPAFVARPLRVTAHLILPQTIFADAVHVMERPCNGTAPW